MTTYYAEFKHTKAIPPTNLGSSRQVFRNDRSASNNYSYKFFVDVDGSLKYQWWNESVWSSSINVFTSGQVTAFDVKVHDTGTLLDVYVVLIDYTNADLTYRKGTIADGGSTVSWSSAQDIDASLNTTELEYHSCAITRTDNAELVVAWGEYNGSNNSLRIIGSDGVGATPSWSGETQITTSTANNVVSMVGLESFSSTYGDRFFVYYSITTGINIIVYVYDWDQGGSGFGQQATDTISPSVIIRGISASIDSNDKVHVGYLEDHLVQHLLYPTAGGLGTEVVNTVTTFTAPEFPEAISLTIDHTTDEVYVFYKNHSETADFYYKKSHVVWIFFGDEHTVTIAEDIDYISTAQRDQDGLIVVVSSPEV